MSSAFSSLLSFIPAFNKKAQRMEWARMDFITTEKLCLKTLSCFYIIIKFNIMFTKENTLIDPDWFEKHN